MPSSTVLLIGVVCLFLAYCIRALYKRAQKIRKQAEEERLSKIEIAHGRIKDLRTSEVEISFTLGVHKWVFATHPVGFPLLSSAEEDDEVSISFIPRQDGGVIIGEWESFAIVKSKRSRMLEEQERNSRKETVKGEIATLMRSDNEIVLTLVGHTRLTFATHPDQFSSLAKSRVGDAVQIDFVPPNSGGNVIMWDLTNVRNLDSESRELNRRLDGLEREIGSIKAPQAELPSNGIVLYIDEPEKPHE